MKLKQLLIESVVDTLNKKYKKASSSVSGLKVRSGVPNTSSISASLYDYEILKNIREFPMKELNSNPKALFYAKNDLDHVRNLAEQIKQSREISPLIIVIDDEGPYVLEGAHRLGALHIVGVKSFPAMVVLDLESLLA